MSAIYHHSASGSVQSISHISHWPVPTPWQYAAGARCNLQVVDYIYAMHINQLCMAKCATARCAGWTWTVALQRVADTVTQMTERLPQRKPLAS